MLSYTRTFLLLASLTQCLASFNILNAISDISSRPLSEALLTAPNFIELAAENGYQAERHDVTTEDGYILTLDRIVPGKNCTRKKPILLMHGLLQSSYDMISAGPFAPGFTLAANGYDVWCGNVRGNDNSRRHVRLNPDKDSEFWDFSLDEIGLYDIPAMVDYVLNKTSSEKLIYIGYSQGGGSYFVMNSERPEYAEKISLFIGLAPVTRLFHLKSAPLFALFKAAETFQAPLESLGVWEVFSKGFPLQGTLSVLCQANSLAAALCFTGVAILDSPNPKSVTPEIENRILKYAPSGTSVTNLKRYGQATGNENFVKMDFGLEENMKLYGSSEPPQYNLNASNVPTIIVHGLSDHCVCTEDIEWAVAQLPNVISYTQVKDPLWNHSDMTYSRFWNETIFSILKQYLLKYDEII